MKILSLFYGLGIRFRNWLFDAKMIHSESFSDIPIICVGNITVGGTGKTPTVELLVEHYSQNYNIAILSRGYGRRTKGYREVLEDDHYLEVGDEPLQMKRKFPNVRVVVCEKRLFAIKRIREEFPEVNMIIMDDGFQHRYVIPLINIIIMDFNRRIDRDHLLPYGQLRDTAESLYRANYFIVTKCPEDMKPLDMRERKWVLKKASQSIFFSRVNPAPPSPVFAGVEATVEYGAKVIAMSGIGDNESFNNGLSQRYDVVATIDHDDHYTYRVSDLARMQQYLDQYPDAVIMTTEKDAVKLARSKAVPETLRQRLFYEKITMLFVENDRAELFAKIDNDLKNIDNDGYIKGL